MKHRETSGVHTVTQSSTGPDRQRHFIRTHGNVDRTQKQMKLGGAAVLDQRTERLQRDIGISLQGVPGQVRHTGLVVADVLAHCHFNGFARPHGGLGDGARNEANSKQNRDNAQHDELLFTRESSQSLYRRSLRASCGGRRDGRP